MPKKGFTLVELMVVIAIIGILFAALIPLTQRYMANARDTSKKLALKQLEAGVLSYQGHYGTYKIPGTGVNDSGMGYANFEGPGLPGIMYNKSLFRALQEMGFISADIKQKTLTNIFEGSPMLNAGVCGVSNTSNDVFMFYFDDKENRYALSAKLEHPTPADIDFIQTTVNGTGAGGTCTRYGRNYAIGN